MKKTIAQKRIEEMTEQGYKLAGGTSGLLSTSNPRSNLSRKLAELKLNADEVTVLTGARAGQYKSEGWQLLIFVKA